MSRFPHFGACQIAGSAVLFVWHLHVRCSLIVPAGGIIFMRFLFSSLAPVVFTPGCFACCIQFGLPIFLSRHSPWFLHLVDSSHSPLSSLRGCTWCCFFFFSLRRGSPSFGPPTVVLTPTGGVFVLSACIGFPLAVAGTPRNFRPCWVHSWLMLHIGQCVWFFNIVLLCKSWVFGSQLLGFVLACVAPCGVSPWL